MPEESQALIRFTAGWAEAGRSEDGLPQYRETIRIIKSVPPYTEVEYEATEQDLDENPGPYQMFLKEQASKMQEPGDAGFPLALWPVISPAMFKMLAQRDINTVEQLAKIAGRADPTIPGSIREVAERAKMMIALSADLGKFEGIILDLTAQRDELAAQVKESAATISAQNSLINTLKLKVA